MPSLLDAYTAPKKDIPRRAYLTVSTLVVTAILAFWCILSYGELVRGELGVHLRSQLVEPRRTGHVQGRLLHLEHPTLNRVGVQFRRTERIGVASLDLVPDLVKRRDVAGCLQLGHGLQ